MFPASTHKGQAVLGFPDVCKTPTPVSGVAPIAYPSVGLAGTKPVSAQQLRDQLNRLHHQLLSMTTQDATRWHALVDQYVVTTADLYKKLTATKPAVTATKPSVTTAYKPGY